MENIKRASKEAKITEQMETEFTVNEQSVRDMVQRALRQEVSKFSPVSRSGKTTPLPRKNSKSRGKDRSSYKIGNSNAVKIPAKMPVTSVAPRPQPKMHKGDEVDQNSGDSPRNRM